MCASRSGAKLLQMKITLRGVQPPVWRRLLVSDRLLLGTLHTLIQRAMGWDASHMHAFYLDGIEYAGYHTACDCGVHCDEDFALHQLVKRRGQRFTYEYDFGDRWMHNIVVEQTEPCLGEPPPRCLAGRRACPPEDCGGPAGYAAFLRDRTSPDPAVLQRWGEADWVRNFDSEHFDLDETNRRLS